MAEPESSVDAATARRRARGETRHHHGGCGGKAKPTAGGFVHHVKKTRRGDGGPVGGRRLHFSSRARRRASQGGRAACGASAVPRRTVGALACRCARRSSLWCRAARPRRRRRHARGPSRSSGGAHDIPVAPSTSASCVAKPPHGAGGMQMAVGGATTRAPPCWFGTWADRGVACWDAGGAGTPPALAPRPPTLARRRGRQRVLARPTHFATRERRQRGRDGTSAAGRRARSGSAPTAAVRPRREGGGHRPGGTAAAGRGAGPRAGRRATGPDRKGGSERHWRRREGAAQENTKGWNPWGRAPEGQDDSSTTLAHDAHPAVARTLQI